MNAGNFRGKVGKISASCLPVVPKLILTDGKSKQVAARIYYFSDLNRAQENCHSFTQVEEMRLDVDFPYIHLLKKDCKNWRSILLPLPQFCVEVLKQIPSYGDHDIPVSGSTERQI